MKRKLMTDDALYTDKSGRLYELKKQFYHTAVLQSMTEHTYLIASKPYITDDGCIEWRNANVSTNYLNAVKSAKEKDIMYESIENRISLKNTASDIDKEISASMHELYHYDLDEAYDKLSLNHSDFDIAQAVALTIHGKSWDGRFSDLNKAWADNFIQAYDVKIEEYRDFFGCDTHPSVLDGFTDVVRMRIAYRSIDQTQDIDNDYDQSYEQSESMGYGRR